MEEKMITKNEGCPKGHPSFCQAVSNRKGRQPDCLTAVPVSESVCGSSKAETYKVTSYSFYVLLSRKIFTFGT